MLEANLQMVFSNKGKWCAHGRTISPLHTFLPSRNGLNNSGQHLTVGLIKYMGVNAGRISRSAVP